MTPILKVRSPRLTVLLLRRLRLERDLVARELEYRFLGAWRCPRRQHLQAHEGARRAADQLHHVVQAPADDVDELAVLALRNAGDAVVGLDLAADRRRASCDHVHDRDVIIDELQRRTDADVRQLHRDVVFLAGARREVVGVRVVDVRIGVHKVFEHVVVRYLLDALEDALVALLQHVARLGPGLVGEHQRQGVVLDALAPQVVEFCLRLDPRRLGAIVGEDLVQTEVRLVFEFSDGPADFGAVALLEAGEDREGGIDIAGADRFAELVAVLLQLGDVAGQEVAAAAV